MRPTCDRWLDAKNDRCNAPAEYIVHGKLFPPEHLGPRCAGCFGNQNPTIRLYNLDQYAVYKLPTQPTKETYTREQLLSGEAITAGIKRREGADYHVSPADVIRTRALLADQLDVVDIAAIDKGKGDRDG